MIFIHHTPDGLKRTADLRDTQWRRTAILLGGAPSLKEQDYKLLEQRGVLVMAMNNAALQVRPTYFVCGDNPNCYDPMILTDPTIMKFGPITWAETAADMYCNGTKFREFPNMYFYLQRPGVPWDSYLATHAEVPWYQNTLLVGIHILYQLGIRRIILAGSDFMFGKSSDYAHGQQLGTLARKWNLDLYNHLVRELRLLKPLFELDGLELMDCSVHSRIAQVYKHISIERAVELCLEGFPAKSRPGDLPHCSVFASKHIREHIAEWPGHKRDRINVAPVSINQKSEENVDDQELQILV
jgi:hypothetical protein